MPPTECPCCRLLREMVSEQHQLLMSFHEAGKDLAQTQVKLAQAEADKQLALAEQARATAQKEKSLTDGGRIPKEGETDTRFGPRGMKRVMSERDGQI